MSGSDDEQPLPVDWIRCRRCGRPAPVKGEHRCEPPEKDPGDRGGAGFSVLRRRVPAS